MTHLKLLTAVLSLAGREVVQLLSEMFSTTLVLQRLKKQVLPACSPKAPCTAWGSEPQPWEFMLAENMRQ